MAGMDAGIFGYLYLAPIIVIIGASAWTSALRRSRWTGVQTAVWTALLASLVTYALAVSEAVRWYALDNSLILASDAVPLDAVGENLAISSPGGTATRSATSARVRMTHRPRHP